MQAGTIAIGSTVYHKLHPGLGAGTVIAFRDRDDKGIMTTKKVLVTWGNHQNYKGIDPDWHSFNELRKTPDEKSRKREFQDRSKREFAPRKD